MIHEVFADHSHSISGYHKLRTRKPGPERYIDLHIVVPRGSTVEDAHSLSHLIRTRIRERLASSQVLVHIEPCNGLCNGRHLVARHYVANDLYSLLTGMKRIYLRFRGRLG